MADRLINVVIATDCGSTTTKAILIEKVGDTYRQTFRGEAPTTVEAPFEDVTKGVLNSIQEIEELSGRKILDGERIITPQNGSEGVDLYLSTSSAGGGLQMMVSGVVGRRGWKVAGRAPLMQAWTIIQARWPREDARNPAGRGGWCDGRRRSVPGRRRCKVRWHSWKFPQLSAA